jgi:hypothetical protein
MANAWRTSGNQLMVKRQKQDVKYMYISRTFKPLHTGLMVATVNLWGSHTFHVLHKCMYVYIIIIIIIIIVVVVIITIIIIIMLLTLISSSYVTDLSLLVLLLLNQRLSPPLRLQFSDCSTFCITCEEPSIVAFVVTLWKDFLVGLTNFSLNLLLLLQWLQLLLV